MKTLLAAVVLSALALTACSDEPPTVTQLQAPDDGTNATVASRLSNGSNVSAERSFWQCSVNGAVLFNLAFYDDSTVRAFDFESSSIGTWTSFDTTAVLTDATGDVINITAIQFPDVNRFTSTFTFSNQLVVASICIRMGDAGTGTQMPVGPVIAVPPPPELINAPLGSDTVDFWGCQLSSNQSVSVVFFRDNTGFLVDSTYVDGIDFQWQSTNRGIVLTLADSNEFVFSTPQFSGANQFSSFDLTSNGANVESATCNRQFITS